MNIQEKIEQGLSDGKTQLFTWTEEINNRNTYGEDVCELGEKVRLLTIWLEILQDYYNKRYLAYNGYKYTSQALAIKLLGRINKLSFNKQAATEEVDVTDFDNSFDNSFYKTP